MNTPFSDSQKMPLFQAFEQTPEYRAMLRAIHGQNLRTAGLHGVYAAADSPEGRAAFELAQQGRGAYLFGLPGRGKTYAAACCVRLAIEHGMSAKLITAKAVLDNVKAEWDGGEKGTLDIAKSYDILALDDIGMERPTEWAMETIEELVDFRTSKGFPIVFTSNYSLGELRERWGGMEGARLSSRIGGACERIRMDGADRRLT